MPGCPVGCCSSVRRLTRKIVATLASQLGVDPAAFAAYLHGRDTTRREHQLELQRDFGFRSFSATIYRELAGWLLPIALSTDVGPVLVGALVDELRERKVLAPALSTIERLAWETRRRAERLVFVRLTAVLTNAQRGQLDALLVVAPGARMTTLAALRQPPRRPTPATFVALAERLQTIRAIGLNANVARQVHQTRLVRLAREGARCYPNLPGANCARLSRSRSQSRPRARRISSNGAMRSTRR